MLVVLFELFVLIFVFGELIEFTLQLEKDVLAVKANCIYGNIFLIVIKIKARGEDAMNGSKLLLFLSAF